MTFIIGGDEYNISKCSSAISSFIYTKNILFILIIIFFANDTDYFIKLILFAKL